MDSARAQGQQTAKATAEQAKTMRDMTTAAHATARDLQLITRANREQSAAAGRVVAQLDEIRRIADRNAVGVKQTRGSTADLLRQAEALTGIVGEAATSPAGGNSRSRARRPAIG
jgi:methyl-accepting chemotaxis protein